MGMDIESGAIQVGSQVEIILRDRAGKQERLTAVIVPAEAADFANGFLGESTPLAQVLMGEKVGTVIPYLKDELYSIEVVSVSKADRMPAGDAMQKREASIRETIRAVEDTNAMMFASSFSGKWGDYDPESLPKPDKPEDQK